MWLWLLVMWLEFACCCDGSFSCCWVVALCMDPRMRLQIFCSTGSCCGGSGAPRAPNTKALAISRSSFAFSDKGWHDSSSSSSTLIMNNSLGGATTEPWVSVVGSFPVVMPSPLLPPSPIPLLVFKVDSLPGEIRILLKASIIVFLRLPAGGSGSSNALLLSLLRRKV